MRCRPTVKKLNITLEQIKHIVVQMDLTYEVLNAVFKLYLYTYKTIGSFNESAGNVEESLFIRYVLSSKRTSVVR